ncbi:MAG: preprotein translocase subunit SecA [Candidatus Moranbacteria bacterium]|nr:preprotein translocase subunit SecA [Candidatus Moranbacteria bacterium]
MSFLSKYIYPILGDPNARTVKKLWPIVEKVGKWEHKIQKLSDEKLRAQTEKFKKIFAAGKTLEDILPETFATAREAARRTLGERPFDVQVMGGIVLHQGKIAEMKTGEGKTLTATMPIYLNAIAGRGVHIVTVNDYLARRDTNWMGAVFHKLGITTACIQHAKSYLFEPNIKPDANGVSIEYQNLKEIPRREAYSADVTYGTNNEFGFDYLRDNMVQNIAEMVQIRDPKMAKKVEGHLNFAIVDEVDSILIDEARTPLIISAPDEESDKLYRKFAQLIPNLGENEHYNIDEKMRAVTLTEEGIQTVENMLGIENIYQKEGITYVHHLQQALRAHALFKLDRDYVVRDGQVVIVDEFTGRMMPGRRFSEGLHQALEAKERVEVQKESKTLATITFQNYFRLYRKLSGMTGTAMTSAEEFSKVYKLEVVSVPTHMPMVRQDLPDRIYKTEKGKFLAVVEEIKRRHQKNQPVLVGTIAIEKSELLSKYLGKEGVDHEILNAKNHEREAQIIAKAGQSGAVTIATNMAGRGTDIKLGKGAKEASGLHILGTERHEARRIDNQLRGRSGRQGDPGSSQFFVSMEDELMRRFGSDRVKKMMDSLGIPEDEAIENRMVSRSIEKAQSRIEGYNFDIRKHVLEYDDVMNKQRTIIYQRRRDLLLAEENLKDKITISANNILKRIIKFHSVPNPQNEQWNLNEISENARAIFGFSGGEQKEILDILNKIYAQTNLAEGEKKEKINAFLLEKIKKRRKEREEMIGSAQMRQIERIVMLRTIDMLWMNHLDNMQYLREGIGLRGYGQRDPLVEYKQEGFRMFEQLLQTIEEESVGTLFKLEFVKQQPSIPPQEERSTIQQRLNQARYSQPEEPTGMSEEGGIEGSGNSKTAALAKNQTAWHSPDRKIGRNDPCPCGSGKKYKKCCGKKT